MRRSLLVLIVIATACGGPSELAAESVVSPAPRSQPIVDLPPHVNPQSVDRPVWEGFAATQPLTHGLVAHVFGPVEVFESPDSAEPFTTVEETTILGTPTVLGVTTTPADGWVEVMLPIRPNGSTGWVRTDDVEIYIADSEITIELSERRLTYRVDGIEVLVTEVGIGSVHNPTPTGHFFVTDNVTLANPNSPWGPHALGLSARSEVITEFNGGDGIIGIHGTNNPSSVGGNISLGCVRLSNDVITTLHHLVPLGTRVTIEA